MWAELAFQIDFLAAKMKPSRRSVCIYSSAVYKCIISSEKKEKQRVLFAMDHACSTFFTLIGSRCTTESINICIKFAKGCCCSCRRKSLTENKRSLLVWLLHVTVCCCMSQVYCMYCDDAVRLDKVF